MSMSGGKLVVGWSDEGNWVMCLSSSKRLAQDHFYDSSCRIPKISKMVNPNMQAQISHQLILNKDDLLESNGRSPPVNVPGFVNSS